MELVDKKESQPKEFPQVEFLLDQELDTGIIIHFIEKINSGGGRNFQSDIFKTHPQLVGVESLSKDEKKRRVEQYVDDYYRKNNEELRQMPSNAVEAWTNYAPTFYKAVGKIFPGLPWPPGEYKGLFTIAPPCPRWLDTKTFQIPSYEPAFWVPVTAHEMLHFMFFEYVRQRYTPQLPNTIEGEMNRLLDGKFQIPLWELSEIFDTAVLTAEDFGRGGNDMMQPYPALGGHLKTFQQIWQGVNGNIGDFFTQIEVKNP